MKQMLAGMCIWALTGCGVEVAGTAATSAAIKKQEVESAKQTKDLVDKKMGEAAQAMQQRNEQQSNAGK